MQEESVTLAKSKEGVQGSQSKFDPVSFPVFLLVPKVYNNMICGTFRFQ